MSVGAVPARQRVDQWLWHARIAKTRTLAQALVERGKVRVNKVRIDRPSYSVKSGDVLTVSLGPRVRVFSVTGCGMRRGPAIEAARLYLELTPEPETSKSAGEGPPGERFVLKQAVRDRGSGRPTKRDRRAIGRFKEH